MASMRTSPRTPSKNKGIAIEKSSSVEETKKQFNHKASWDSESTRIFLQLIADEITKGNHPFLVLRQTRYKSLAKKFEKKTGKKHGLKQLKNKYMSLKKEWNAWRKLMVSSKGISRIGFDSETGLFQASDAWWDNMESTNKVCAKFRKKTLEHRKLMETVFTGTSATSKNHWTSGETVAEPATISLDSVDSIGLRPFVDPIPAWATDVDQNSSMELVETAMKRKQTSLTSCAKSKKATSGASIIAERINNLTNVVRTQNQQVIVRHLIGNESQYTISECMQRLRAISSLLGTPLFHFASTLMDNADYREVMMCQPDDDHIIGWLTQKQLQCGVAAPFANLFGARWV
ncbi:uncharacterized protein LOC114309090 [Camellia sinensis]|uniref:uncharacterized protein LOC114309090 n=1 Tax=Camellia sinensis TaxID=4442 RepID=UPI00103558E2|nr:uncharacterized protein LOC114309090 [Camellia sinensis]